MNLFNRAIRIFLLVAGGIVAVVTVLAALFARRILTPPRIPLWSTPDEVGLDYMSVQFPARGDGLRLSGWFMTTSQYELGTKRPTVIMVHGWPWQRLGEEPTGFLAKIMCTSRVDLLRLAKAISDAGYHVLMFDLRNHGESASGGPVTFGVNEAKDLLGAVDYVNSLSAVDSEHVGVIGFSMGANTVLHALAQTDEIKAAVAVQPTSPSHFAPRLANDLAGPLGKLIVPLAEWLVEQGGGQRFSAMDPRQAVPYIGSTPILFVQGAGDKWGSIDNVTDIAEGTSNTIDLIVATGATDRYSGYRYVIDHPHISTSFFDDYL